MAALLEWANIFSDHQSISLTIAPYAPDLSSPQLRLPSMRRKFPSRDVFFAAHGPRCQFNGLPPPQAQGAHSTLEPEPLGPNSPLACPIQDLASPPQMSVPPGLGQELSLRGKGQSKLTDRLDLRFPSPFLHPCLLNPARTNIASGPQTAPLRHQRVHST